MSVTPELLRADLSGREELASLLGLRVAPDWPPQFWEPPAIDYLLQRMTQNAPSGWCRFVCWREAESEVLVGTCGALTPLTEDLAEIEVGYSVVPSFQRRGIATEALGAFVRWIFSHPHIQRIHAQTFPHIPESIRVMERNGFQPAGAGFEEGAVLFRLERENVR